MTFHKAGPETTPLEEVTPIIKYRVSSHFAQNLAAGQTRTHEFAMLLSGSEFNAPFSQFVCPFTGDYLISMVSPVAFSDPFTGCFYTSINDSVATMVGANTLFVDHFSNLNTTVNLHGVVHLAKGDVFVIKVKNSGGANFYSTFGTGEGSYLDIYLVSR
jgi:hypothetical protein